ncbi:hypothetical protein GTP90_02700 [Rugamonas sp. FT81W]|uniref:XRE family transcriptional regulator n=2 Tax=Duganella vulcania TaxID=2692166 RepID=A0A845GI81_9BURK|nr:hypothetical protein [Duganella vulcania]
MSEHNTVSKQVEYDPARLVDGLIERMQLKNDAALAKRLDVQPPVISKVRNRRLAIGATLLLRMHDASNLSIAELRDMYGERRTSMRFGPTKVPLDRE